MLAIHVPGMYVLAAREQGYDPDVPLIVARDAAVLDASPEVLDRGVEIGMPMRRARRLASGVIVADEPSTVVALHERVWDLLAAVTPLLEVLDYHEAVADLTGCFRGMSLVECAETVRTDIHETTGLEARIGGGSTFTSAWIASLGEGRSEHNGFVPRWKSEETRLIAQAPLTHCPFVPNDAGERLMRLGLRLVRDLEPFSEHELSKLVGKGLSWPLKAFAAGREIRPIRSNYPPKTVEASERFMPPTDMEPRVMAVFHRLIEEGNERLSLGQEKAVELSVAMEFEGGETRQAKTRFARRDVTAPMRASRFERLLREVWEGQEVVELSLIFGAIQPYEAEQTSIWEDIRRQARRATTELMEMASARFGNRCLVRAESTQPTSRFAALSLMDSGVCPLGSGWFC
jgi:nucleotidyltransferase/DNA polymerase involved in DNA repair